VTPSKGSSPCLRLSDLSRPPSWNSNSQRRGSKSSPGRRDNWRDRNPAFDPANQRPDRPPFKQPFWGDSDSSDVSDDDYQHRGSPPGQWGPPYEYGEKPPWKYWQKPPYEDGRKPPYEKGEKPPYKYGKNPPGNGKWGKVN